jgi:signal transduction histidine kinase
MQSEQGRATAYLANLEHAFCDAPSFLGVFRGPTHVLVLANDAGLRFLGRGREIFGKPIGESVPEFARQGFVARLDEVLRTGDSFLGHELPFVIGPPEGGPTQERYFEFTYAPLVDPDGTRSGVVAHGFDVTAHVHTRRDLETSRRRREEILGVVSHDLRNPLSAITLAAHALEDELERSVNPRLTHAVAVIERSAAWMGRMIDDLLDVVSIESGHLACERGPARVRDIVERAADEAESGARDAGVTVETALDDAVTVVDADAERVVQAIGNLVSNAVKFTPPGGRVTISAATEDRFVRFDIEDTGVGIEAEELDHVFDRFWQGAASRARGGAGLGLAIVRGIVEAHGGRLAGESTPGRGSRFSFTVPGYFRHPSQR